MKKVMSIVVAFLMLSGFSSTCLAATDAKAEVLSTVDSYFTMMYDSYMDLSVKDFSGILDMSVQQNLNKVQALSACIDSWQYSLSKGYLSSDDRVRADYSLTVSDFSVSGDTAKITVLLSGNTGVPYPLFISFGANTFSLQRAGDNWFITSHEYAALEYFELYVNKVYIVDPLVQHANIDSEYLLTNLAEDSLCDINPKATPYEDIPYNSARAIAYANKYYLNQNTYFYEAVNDCSNFVSQCIAYGFGTSTTFNTASSYRMTTGWFGDSGGGLASWEQVEPLYNYMIRSKGSNEEGPRVQMRTATEVGLGGIVQFDFENDGTWSHSAIVIGKTSGGVYRLAQHSENTIRLLTDYAGSKRGFMPISFRTF